MAKINSILIISTLQNRTPYIKKLSSIYRGYGGCLEKVRKTGATANIDTITEQLLDEILRKLPSTTTRVIIAHRLNTIENADEIFFVNTGNVTLAGSFKDAVNLLLNEKIES
jgi:hypothetical protein